MNNKPNFSQERRDAAGELCWLYITNNDLNFADKTSIIALAVAVEFGFSEETLITLCQEKDNIRDAVLWYITQNWNDQDEELAKPFVDLKESVKGDIDYYAKCVDWILINRLWNGCLSKFDIDIPESETKTKPILNSVFFNIVNNYVSSMWETIPPNGVTDPATVTTIENIGNDTDPSQYELDDFKSYIDEIVVSTFEWTSTINGIKNYLNTRIVEEENIEEQAFYWGIGDTYESDGEICKCDYPTYEAFIENIDYSLVIKVLKKCWDRACSSGELFPEDEALTDYAKAFIGTSETIG